MFVVLAKVTKNAAQLRLQTFVERREDERRNLPQNLAGLGSMLSITRDAAAGVVQLENWGRQWESSAAVGILNEMNAFAHSNYAILGKSTFQLPAYAQHAPTERCLPRDKIKRW